MNDNKKDPRSTNSQTWPRDRGNFQPVEGDGDNDKGTKTEEEVPDTHHEHTYNIPVGDKYRQEEERILELNENLTDEDTQNSNPGKNNNSDQNLNQAS